MLVSMNLRGAPTGVGESLRGRKADLLAGLALAGLVACMVIPFQLSKAAKELPGLRAHKARSFAEPSWPDVGWPLTAAVGAFLALAVYCVLRAKLIEQEVSRAKRRAFALVTGLAVACWLTWQGAGIAVFRGAELAPTWMDAALGATVAFTALALALASEAVGSPSDGWERASVVRVQLIVLGGLIIAFFLVPITAAQTSDVLRAWGDGPVSRVAVGVAGALLMGAVVRASAGRLLAPRPREGRWPETTVPALIGAAVACVVFIVLGAWVGLVVLAALVGLACATKWQDPREPDDAARYRLMRLAGTLGVVPLAVVYAGLVAAATDTFLLPDVSAPSAWRLLATSVAVGLAFGLVAAFAHPQRERAVRPLEEGRSWALPVGLGACLLAGLSVLDVVSVLFALGAALVASWVLPERGGPQFWAAGGATLGVSVAVYAAPVAAPRELGALGLVLIAGAGLLAALHLAATLGARREFRAKSPLLPARIPVVTLLAAWVALAWLMRGDDAHQVRTTPEGQPPAKLQEAVDAWVATRVDGTEERVPMVVVAASGGGAKASYWTGLVIDCLFGGEPPTESARECSRAAEGDRFRRLFLSSSVSGGSIGMYHVLHGRRSSGNWVDPHSGREVLSPVLAWGIFHDLPQFVLGRRSDPRDCTGWWSCRREADRALVQEAAIAERDGIIPPEGEKLLDAWTSRFPVTVFNAAQDGAERRVLISPVLLDTREPSEDSCATVSTPQLGPDALDAHDLLNGSPMGASVLDVPLVTAAHMSARFPLVEPAAQLGETGLGKQDEECSVGSRSVVLRDGGYFENSGVLTIEALLPELRRSIAEAQSSQDKKSIDIPIVVISIDDDPIAGDADPELDLLPKSVGIATRAGPAALTAGSRSRIRRCQYPNVHYERISPEAHAGAEAATGWELSETARTEDLVESLTPGHPAWSRLVALRAVIEGTADVSCPDHGR